MSIHRFRFTGSSMLLDLDYDDAEKELSVTFTNGKTYTYVGVPKSVYDDLINAASAGKHFNMIKKDLTQKHNASGNA